MNLKATLMELDTMGQGTRNKINIYDYVDENGKFSK